jgi:alpha-beta hydrolase superfamily lysophospholipase
MTGSQCVEREFDLTCGAVRLHGRLVEPAEGVRARLLIIHGYGEHSGRYLHFMRWMAAQGASCTAVDLRGHGLSSGRRGYVRKWEEYLDDMREILLSVNAPDDNTNLPLFLLGHSHGGLVTAAAGELGMLSTIRGVILSSPYLATCVPPTLVKRIFARIVNHLIPWLRVKSGLKPEWLSSDPAMIIDDQSDKLLNRSATPRWFFTMRPAQTRVRREASAFKLPLLCLTGEADMIADPAAAIEFYERAGSADRSFYSYPDQVHELLRDVGRKKVFADVLEWITARI